MAKSILKLITISLFILLVWGCTERKVSPEKDLTLPDFSFVGLSEPLADKKNIKVSVHTKLPYSELQFIRSGGEFIARYEIGINISDKAKERIAGNIWSDTLRVDSYQKTRSETDHLFLVKSFTVPPSELTISVRVTDLYTRKSRVLEDGVDQSKMYVGELALGNIMLIDDQSKGENKLLMDRSFYEIMDTLRFSARILGENGPYSVSYELTAKDESKLKQTEIIDHSGAIDSLLSFVVPLNDMHYTNYMLFLSAKDGTGNHVTTKTNFGVHIQGIKFDVGDVDEAVKQLIYITDERQIRHILSGSAEDIGAKFRSFWAAIDPTPKTVENELMDEYYRRVAFTIEAFTVVTDGWRSDRGMIYILFGPPDEIQRGPFEINRKPYQVWDYFRLGKQFVFRDETGFGDYRLDQTYLDENDWRFRY